MLGKSIAGAFGLTGLSTLTKKIFCSPTSVFVCCLFRCPGRFLGGIGAWSFRLSARLPRNPEKATRKEKNPKAGRSAPTAGKPLYSLEIWPPWAIWPPSGPTRIGAWGIGPLGPIRVRRPRLVGLGQPNHKATWPKNEICVWAWPWLQPQPQKCTSVDFAALACYGVSRRKLQHIAKQVAACDKPISAQTFQLPLGP